MLKELQIKNFKSVLDDTISLGRVNVFIGENGSGKSNILEALMFASLAKGYSTVDADLMYSNGIRVSKPSLMTSSFEDNETGNNIEINLNFGNINLELNLEPENDSIHSKWKTPPIIINSIEFDRMDITLILMGLENENLLDTLNEKHIKIIKDLKADSKLHLSLLEESAKDFGKFYILKNDIFQDFIIYSLNTEALRGIPEFQRSRKGIYGENLDLIINELSKEELEELKEYLYTISWLDDFFIDEKDELKKEGYKLNHSKSLLYFKDRFMSEENSVFSSENSNEGILHILFYLASLISSKTPKLFAIDNIETSLNPHLCRHIMTEMSELTKKHEKQILVTTHNPAILDGLNLNDDDIRLFEVFRTDNGDTKTRRIKLKPEIAGKQYKLSDLWTRGHLGAISQRF